VRDLLVSVPRELARRPGRTLLQVVAFALSLGILVVVGTLLFLTSRELANVLHTVGTHLVFFRPEPQGKGLESADTPALLDPEHEAFFAEPQVVTSLLPMARVDDLEKIPGVRQASPVLRFRMRNPLDGTLFTIAGFRPGDEVVLNSGMGSQDDLIKGAFLRPGDRGMVVLDEPFALSFGLGVGSRVVLAGRSFPVIGIVRPGIRPLQADLYLAWEDAMVVINRRLIGSLGDRTNTILIELRHASMQENTLAAISRAYPDSIVNSFNCYAGAADVMGMSSTVASVLLVAVFCGLTLFAAISQWGSVLERRRDLGVLRALGWSARTVLWQVILETLFIALAGGCIGIMAGLAVVHFCPSGVLSDRPLPPVGGLFWLIAATGLGVAILSGALASVLPAIQAVRHSPAQSLRTF